MTKSVSGLLTFENMDVFLLGRFVGLSPDMEDKELTQVWDEHPVVFE